jgi:hypothetical protein
MLAAANRFMVFLVRRPEPAHGMARHALVTRWSARPVGFMTAGRLPDVVRQVVTVCGDHRLIPRPAGPAEPFIDDAQRLSSDAMPNDPQDAPSAKPAFDPYARPSLPNIPPPDDTGGPVRAMWCSDCRAPLRTYYFAMNTRPVCSKCKLGYEAQIARGTGSAAVVRAAVWGVGTALASAAVLAGVLLTIGAFGRILMAIGIGWAIGTAIKKANGGYPGVHYQILAAVLTYFAIGLGSIAPVVREVSKARALYVADSTRGARDDSARAVLAAQQREESGITSEPVADEGQELTALDRIDSATSPEHARRRAVSGANAERFAKGGFLPKLVAGEVLMFTLPLLSLFTFGVYGAVITIGAFGYGMYKAWDLTSGGPALEVSGPHKVGAGPIAPSF